MTPEGPAAVAPSEADDDFAGVDPTRILQTMAIVFVLVVAIYVVLPQVAGIDDSVKKIGDGSLRWFGLGMAFNLLAFGSYVALFRGVVGRDVRLAWNESYQITMAGIAASRVFSAGGAGGIALSYWALRRAGMARAVAVVKMVAFLVLLYLVYVLGLIIFGVLLRTGVLRGESPVSMTIVPAAISGGVLVALALVGLVPGDLQRRFEGLKSGGALGRLAHRLVTVPATVSRGIREAIRLLQNPRQAGLITIGAVGFWAANVAILWACFEAFGLALPIAVVVQGFFVGMVANLAPAPGGVGAVDGGMIGAFLAFGYPLETVITVVLVYRVIAFWTPVPPGVVAFFQLRQTVARWKAEGRVAPDDPLPAGAAP